ncbi:hypothetical protein B0A48_18850 [Cryoendolithus antarcticus]|uniref:Uncharacterized protein n=1 Tax=Cryoendolithus antarcticus TaxID=1507870 RepID=A0A1V8S719_9PEZI|nr:hypothetical protein B0A48_18850 [Cryoendolithus antarcticus]
MSAEDALKLFLPQSQQDRAIATRHYQDRGETTQFLDAMYSQILNRSRASVTRGAVVRDAPSPIKETLGAIAALSEPLPAVNSGQQLCDDGQVHRFLLNHFLHWLEALSWIGKLSNAIAYISSLQSITQESRGTTLRAFLEDARRFILRNRYVVNLAPLQIYNSALVFAPTQSLVRNIFLRQIPQLLARLPNVQMYWSAEILKLEGHDEWAVASASDDKTVRLWDAATGEQTQKLEGHDARVTAVAFSPDGHAVASASWDKTVRLWDAATGEQTQKLEGHDGGVTAVAFSPDGQAVASASGDKTVRLWDAVTGEQMQCYTSPNRPTRVRFTDDGSALDTDVGILSLNPLSRRINTSPSTPNLSISLASPWLQYNGMDILWLPHEYRGVYSTTYGRNLVIGQASGAVSFFSIAT